MEASKSMAVWFEKVPNWSDGRLDHQSIPLLITPSHTYSSSTTNVIWLNIAMTALMITMSLREKVAYLTEGGEEVEDIKVNYPRFERNQVWLKKTHINVQGSPSDCPARAQEGRRVREQHERLWNCRRNGKRGQILQKNLHLDVKSFSSKTRDFLFQAAKTEYHTFSSLVRVLVKYCTSELDKARAIFR